jgi:hypothetical protein
LIFLSTLGNVRAVREMTKRVGGVLKPMCSGGTWFKTPLGYRLPFFLGFRGFLQPSWKFPGQSIDYAINDSFHTHYSAIILPLSIRYGVHQANLHNKSPDAVHQFRW